MKKLLTIFFIFCFTYSFGQTPYFFDRSSGVNTVQDVRSAAKYNFYIPRLTDTTLMGGVDTLGAVLLVKSGSKQGFWYRDSVSTGGHKWSRIAATTETYWTLNGADLYANSTSYDVGIGTTNPEYRLDVQNGGRMFFDGSRLGLYDNTTRNNVLVGQLTGSSLSTTYTDNVFLGGSAGRFVTGNFNVAIGTTALQNSDKGNNSAIGYRSLYLTDSTDNTAFGYLSGLANYGTQNVSIGSGSGNYLSLGNNNVNNSEITTSSTVITGATTSTFISAQSLSVGVKYPLLLHFNGTAPEPYNSSGITDLYVDAVVTNSSTLTLSNASNFTTQGTSTTTITLYNKQNNSIAIGYNARTIQSNQIVLGNSNNTRLQANQLVIDISDVPASGEVITWDGTKGVWAAVPGGGGGAYSFVSPLSETAGVVTLQNAAADGSTKGAASFTAADFNASSGNISLDYTNGQAASTTLKGFLTNTDWNTFNGKLSNITGLVTAGTNISITGSGTSGSPYVINSSGSGSGSVTNVSGVAANGFTWSIANATTTPAITLTLQNATTAQSGQLTSTDWNTFNGKQATITGAATTITTSNLTSSRVLVSGATGKVEVSTVTSTDLLNFKLLYTAQSLTDGATITMDCSNGYVGSVTINGSRNITFTNITNNYTVRLRVTQGAAGNYTLTFPANTIIPVGFGSGTTLNLSTGGGDFDKVFVTYNGTNYEVEIGKNYTN